MPVDPSIKIIRLRPHKDGDIALPRYMTKQSAGMDICAAIENSVIIDPGKIAMVSTGFALAIPEGFEAQIRPRSGLAIKSGITVINSPGTVDADYRGEVKVALINLGHECYTISRGDRVAQMIISRVYQARLDLVEQLDETKRSTGGFGHTGI
jgi:dUTP pyrophosphatase